jgi:hypothetical protein
METRDEMVEEWRAMKAKLEHQLSLMGDAPHETHGHTARDTIRRWVVELDDLIIKYSFEI